MNVAATARSFLALLLAGATAAQQDPLALVGATVYDGTGRDPIEDGVVVLREGRIVAVGPRAATRVPAGARVVDVSGRYVTPGLVDTHVHYSQTGWADGRPDAVDVRAEHPYEQAMAELWRQPSRFHRAFLSCGVTAVFDVGGYPWTRRLGERTEASPTAPHVAATGALLSTYDPGLGLPDQSQFVLLTDEEAARRAVRAHAASGSAAIKVWYIVRRGQTAEELAPLVMAVGDEARSQGLPLVVHATGLAEAKVALRAGARLLVHSVEDRPVDDEFVEAAVAAEVFYCPTLTVRAGYFQLYTRRLSAEVRSQLPFVDPSVRVRVLRTETLEGGRRLEGQAAAAYAERARRQRQVMASNLLRLHRAGVRVVLGTDAGNPLTLHGPSVFPELEAMQAAGLAPREVLTAATAHAADAMGRGEDLGVLAAGRIADLLVLEKDPGEGVANLRSITHVCRAGVLHARADLMPEQ